MSNHVLPQLVVLRLQIPTGQGDYITGHLVDHPTGFVMSPSQAHITCYVVACPVGRAIVSYMCLLQARATVTFQAFVRCMCCVLAIEIMVVPRKGTPYLSWSVHTHSLTLEQGQGSCLTIENVLSTKW